MSTIAEDHFLIYLNSEGIHFMCGCWGVSENIAFITGFNIPSRFQDFDKEEKKKIKWIFIFIGFLIWEISMYSKENLLSEISVFCCASPARGCSISHSVISNVSNHEQFWFQESAPSMTFQRSEYCEVSLNHVDACTYRNYFYFV